MQAKIIDRARGHKITAKVASGDFYGAVSAMAEMAESQEPWALVDLVQETKGKPFGVAFRSCSRPDLIFSLLSCGGGPDMAMEGLVAVMRESLGGAGIQDDLSETVECLALVLPTMFGPGKELNQESQGLADKVIKAIHLSAKRAAHPVDRPLIPDLASETTTEQWEEIRKCIRDVAAGAVANVVLGLTTLLTIKHCDDKTHNHAELQKLVAMIMAEAADAVTGAFLYERARCGEGKGSDRHMVQVIAKACPPEALVQRAQEIVFGFRGKGQHSQGIGQA